MRAHRDTEGQSGPKYLNSKEGFSHEEQKNTVVEWLYRETLGWAIAQEFGYQTTYQCGFYDTGRKACYLYHPDGRLIGIDMYLSPTHGLWQWWDYAKP